MFLPTYKDNLPNEDYVYAFTYVFFVNCLIIITTAFIDGTCQTYTLNQTGTIDVHLVRQLEKSYSDTVKLCLKYKLNNTVDVV